MFIKMETKTENSYYLSKKYQISIARYKKKLLETVDEEMKDIIAGKIATLEKIEMERSKRESQNPQKNTNYYQMEYTTQRSINKIKRLIEETDSSQRLELLNLKLKFLELKLEGIRNKDPTKYKVF